MKSRQSRRLMVGELVFLTDSDSLLPEWKGVPIHATLKQGMVALQFSKPTDIQSRAVPPALDGRDIVGVAETVS